jgi:hypothetical protein
MDTAIRRWQARWTRDKPTGIQGQAWTPTGNVARSLKKQDDRGCDKGVDKSSDFLSSGLPRLHTAHQKSGPGPHVLYKSPTYPLSSLLVRPGSENKWGHPGGESNSEGLVKGMLARLCEDDSVVTAVPRGRATILSLHGGLGHKPGRFPSTPLAHFPAMGGGPHPWLAVTFFNFSDHLV